MTLGQSLNLSGHPFISRAYCQGCLENPVGTGRGIPAPPPQSSSTFLAGWLTPFPPPSPSRNQFQPFICFPVMALLCSVPRLHTHTHMPMLISIQSTLTLSHTHIHTHAHCWCSVAQYRLTPCDPTDNSTPGFPVLHHLMEFAPTRVH